MLKTRAARIRQRKRQFPSRNPNKRAAAVVIVSRDWCDEICRQCLRKSSAVSAARYLRSAVLPYLPKRSDWYRAFQMLAAALSSGVPSFPVFQRKGNSKLPFVAFSTLPQYTCPGAGACLAFCYSYTSWRYPAAFCRQLQNTLFMRYYRQRIADDFARIPCKGQLHLRLYVDGDFADSGEVSFWMHLIADRPELQVYGYSKSWAQMLEHSLQGGTFPPNYVLNLSSGSRYSERQDIIDAMMALKDTSGKHVVRGWFLAVKIDTTGIPSGKGRYETPEYHRRVRDAVLLATGNKGISCPGDCGACGVKEGAHFCGSKRLHGITIGNGIH